VNNVFLGANAVLFIGRAGAGKTEAAERVIDTVFRARKYPMALELKRIAIDMGWDGAKDQAGRRLLQHLGDVGREYNPNVWVDGAIRALWNDWVKGVWANVFVADDVRYLNEMERISEKFLSVCVIKIVRPHEGNLSGLEILQHRSERFWSILPYDFEVLNNGSIADLHNEIDAIIEEIGLGC